MAPSSAGKRGCTDLIDIPLACRECGLTAPPGIRFTGCPSCGGVLLVHQDPAATIAAWEQRRMRAAGVTRIAIGDAAGPDPGLLGEGGTALLPAPGMAASFGLDELWIKHEGCEPTGTYKDRLNAVTVTVAAAAGYRRIVTSSTGNQGVSLAAYAAAAGLEADVFLPEEAPVQAVREVRRLGGTAHVRRWADRLPEVKKLVAQGAAYAGRNFPNPLANPYGLEGYKSIAYEVVDQLGGVVPDTVVMPSCGGDGIFGVWRGFRELRAAGIVTATPAMVAAHIAAAPAVARAFDSGASEVTPIAVKPSRALSLVDERGGAHGLWALRESGGTSITIEENELGPALSAYGTRGIVAEPAAAAALAAVMRLPEQKMGGRVVVVMTGVGARWPETWHE